MVDSATSCTGSGVRDWLVQRITAVVLAAYVLYLGLYLLLNAPIQYVVWQQLFASNSIKIFTILAFGSLALHAWVGMWTVLTDYIKPVLLRVSLQVVVIITLLIYFLYGFKILWGF